MEDKDESANVARKSTRAFHVRDDVLNDCESASSPRRTFSK